MKKIVCTLLSLLLLLGGALALVACNAASAPEIPEGYQKFADDCLSFAYPENWKKSTGSTVILTNPTGAGNNITVVYEPQTDLYKNMTAQTFIDTIKPSFDAVNMSIYGVSVTQTTSNGQDVTKINYTASLSGVTMEQTVFVITVDDRTYSVTVTETAQDDALVDTVFNTLYPIQ